MRAHHRGKLQQILIPFPRRSQLHSARPARDGHRGNSGQTERSRIAQQPRPRQAVVRARPQHSNWRGRQQNQFVLRKKLIHARTELRMPPPQARSLIVAKLRAPLQPLPDRLLEPLEMPTMERGSL